MLLEEWNLMKKHLRAKHEKRGRYFDLSKERKPKNRSSGFSVSRSKVRSGGPGSANYFKCIKYRR